jgi:hypothetical protein
MTTATSLGPLLIAGGGFRAPGSGTPVRGVVAAAYGARVAHSADPRRAVDLVGGRNENYPPAHR